jgi:hypothetical protein
MAVVVLTSNESGANSLADINANFAILEANRRKVVTVTQSATPAINTDVTTVAYITGLAQNITSFTTNLTGTPSNGDTLIVDITDNGTGQTITWGAKFESSGNVILPGSTTASTKLTVGFRWNSVTSKWTCIAYA